MNLDDDTITKTTWRGDRHGEGCTYYYEIIEKCYDGVGFVDESEVCHKDFCYRRQNNYGDIFLGWGYNGRGPRQLAFMMLIISQDPNRAYFNGGNHVPKSIVTVAKQYAERYAAEVVSKFGKTWTRTSAGVKRWLNNQIKNEKQTTKSTKAKPKARAKR